MRGADQGACPSVMVLGDEGSELGSVVGCGTESVELPAAGTYRVRVTANTAIASGVFTLWGSTPATGSTVQLDDQMVVPSLVPGQRARFGFTAIQGQVVSFVAAGAGDLDVQLLLADVATATSSLPGAPGAVFTKLPVSGQFTVEVRNAGSASTSATAVVLHAALQMTGGAVPAVAPTLRAGGSAAWTVDAPGSEIVVATSEPARCVLLRVSDADGVTGEGVGCGGAHLPAPNGPGTVEVLNLTPASVSAGGITVASVAPLGGGTVPDPGTVTSPSASRGQTVNFVFSPTSNGIRAVQVAGPVGSCPDVTITRSDGAEIASAAGCNATGVIAFADFEAGTDYTLNVADGNEVGTAGAVTATVSQLSDVDAGALEDGVTASSPPLGPGQRPVWSYPGTAAGGIGELTVTYAGPGCAGVAAPSAGSGASLGEACDGSPLITDWLAFGDTAVAVTPTTSSALAAGVITIRFTPSSEPPPVPADLSAALESSDTVRRVGPMPNLLEPAGNSCADVLMLGARGSGELPGSAVYGKPPKDAVGTRVRNVYSSLQRRFDNANITIELAALCAYPANGVELLFRRKINQYFDGIETGVAEGVATLQGYARSCPGQRIVLAGYSQGAMVAHRIINELDRTRQDDILRRIDGTVLLADGDRRGGAKEAVHHGTADRGSNGISWTVGDMSLRPYAHRDYKIEPSRAYKAKLPVKMRSRVHSICFKSDIVCDFTLSKLGVGGDVHSLVYNGGSEELTAATRAVADRILTQPSIGALLTAPTLTPQIAAGSDHSCAVVAGGQVKCWGYNLDGQLGDGTFNSSWVPVSVSGLSGVTQIAAGYQHSCAVVSGGQVKCWGWNNFGELGNGTAVDSLTPVLVSGLSGVTQIAAGYGHSCAVVSGGQVKCWGWNLYGELGNGTTVDSLTPVLVSGLSGVTQIAAGYGHSCALVAGGQVKCWGSNGLGQLGNGTYTDSLTPVSVGFGQSSGQVASVSASRAGDTITVSWSPVEVPLGYRVEVQYVTVLPSGPPVVSGWTTVADRTYDTSAYFSCAGQQCRVRVAAYTVSGVGSYVTTVNAV